MHIQVFRRMTVIRRSRVRQRGPRLSVTERAADRAESGCARVGASRCYKQPVGGGRVDVVFGAL